MKLGDIARRVRIAAEIHKSSRLKELIQRQLTKRSREIGVYLLKQPQRFSNALVIGVYGGSPQWHEVSVRRSRIAEPRRIPANLKGTLGFLVLSGDERLFAIDGQHRVAGVRMAVRQRAAIASEEIAALFVGHETSVSGMERTRRLFTTLNRYAKPVSKKDIIALDEDDPIAITTRRLIEEYPLFRDKVSLAQPRNIPPSDRQNFTTIVALYDVLDILLRPSERDQARSFKQLRPDDRRLERYYTDTIRFWGRMERNFTAIGGAATVEPGQEFAFRYRHRNGGQLLFRPIGLILAVRVIRDLIESGTSQEQAIRRIARVPMELDELPWRGLLWNRQACRMITEGANQRSARKVLLYGAGGDLSRLKTDQRSLRQEVADLTGVEVRRVRLRRY